MTDTSYNDIAEWYDAFVQERPIYREVVLPNLLALVGDVQGQAICDLACGQGWIARELAQKGAKVTGADLAENLLALSQQYEAQNPLGIVYLHDDAQGALSLADANFDGVICVLALINIPDLGAVFRTVWRILKPGGWFTFVITHPCFETPYAGWITTEEGTRARTVSGYFHERIWVSRNPAGVRGKVGDHHRTLSTYLNTLITSDFVIEKVLEPATIGAGTHVEQLEVPSLLLLRAHKT